MITESNRILIIDDDVDICALLKRFLERKSFIVETAFNAKDGLARAATEKFDLILTDFRLPDKDGLEVIREIKSMHSKTPIIVITGYSDVQQAIEAIRLGAAEYVTKPIYPEEILLHIQKAIEGYTAADSDSTTRLLKPSRGKSKPSHPDYILGNSHQSKRVQEMIELVAPTDMTVVVLGESGTGKEVVARKIHDYSNRSKRPFIAVDCGALPPEIAGSELFGHVKGAFTGAVNDKKGQFELANGGTLFLDEIGNLSYENQVKLLRVFQERNIRRLGSESDQPIDVRIIVATNEDLRIAMEKGTFREDIYHRLNEFKIELPALRESSEDIRTYSHFFLLKANEELNKQVQKIDEDAQKALCHYHWPGNIRELKNILKRAVLLTNGDILKSTVLPSEVTNPIVRSKNIDNSTITDLKTVVEKAEKEAILRVLEMTANNKTKTAELLGVDRKTLYNKLNIYGIL
jgi:two-component system, NtrC family, response regulator HydG